MGVRPEGSGLVYTVIISIWMGLSTIVTVLRVFVRIKTHAWGWDDWLMCLGWAVFVLFVCFNLVSVHYGFGAHAYRISEYDAQRAEKWFLFASISYAIATAPIKASICVLLMRITSGKRIYHYILYGVIAISIVATVARVIAYLTRCQPIAAYWDPIGTHGTCSSAAILTDMSYSFGAICILTDWICAVIPAFVVWDVQLSTRNKIYVVMIMALGIFASIATIIRMKYLVAYQDPHDYFYGLVPIALWSGTETCFGIIAGSLPTMRPLLQYIPSLAKYSSANRMHATGHGAPSYNMAGLGQGKRSKGTKSELGNSTLVDAAHNPKDEEESDGGSQRHILTDTRLEIYKESHYEVRSEREEILGQVDPRHSV